MLSRKNCFNFYLVASLSSPVVTHAQHESPLWITKQDIIHNRKRSSYPYYLTHTAQTDSEDSDQFPYLLTHKPFLRIKGLHQPEEDKQLHLTCVHGTGHWYCGGRILLDEKSIATAKLYNTSGHILYYTPRQKFITTFCTKKHESEVMKSFNKKCRILFESYKFDIINRPQAQEIKAAYKRQSLQHHPDKMQNRLASQELQKEELKRAALSETTSKMADINAAKEEIKNFELNALPNELHQPFQQYKIDVYTDYAYNQWQQLYLDFDLQSLINIDKDLLSLLSQLNIGCKGGKHNRFFYNVFLQKQLLDLVLDQKMGKKWENAPKDTVNLYLRYIHDTGIACYYQAKYPLSHTSQYTWECLLSHPALLGFTFHLNSKEEQTEPISTIGIKPSLGPFTLQLIGQYNDKDRTKKTFQGDIQLQYELNTHFYHYSLHLALDIGIANATAITLQNGNNLPTIMQEYCTSTLHLTLGQYWSFDMTYTPDKGLSCSLAFAIR